MSSIQAGRAGEREVSQMSDKIYWLSWIQPTEDFRPLNDPPRDAVLGWWCSGYDGSDNATLCAGVLAKSGAAAKKTIQHDWPEAAIWRFCEEQAPDFTPGDRFPLKGWAKERWDVAVKVRRNGH
jgi:hypothetical protein